jgi:hypothetical protein
MPSKYAVVYTVKPSVRLLANYDFTVNLKEESIRILAADIAARSDNGKFYAVGLRVEIRVDANNPDEASEKANKWASGFVSILSFVSNIGVGNIQSELVCDISESQTKRTYLQFFHGLPIPTPSAGKVDGAVLSDVQGKLIEEKPEYSDRVGRALAFYTKGLRETHPLERFMSFWLGLETLNEPLKDALSAPDVFVTCDCGRKRKVSTLTGVRELMKRELPDGEAAFIRLRGIRVAVMHSTRPLAPIMPEIGKEADLIQELLRKTIFRFLDVPYQGDIVKPPISNLVPLWTALEGVIEGVPSTDKLKSSGEYPHLVPSIRSVQTIVENDSSVTISPKVDHNPVGLPEGAKFSITGSRMYGEKGKVKNAKMTSISTSNPGEQRKESG